MLISQSLSRLKHQTAANYVRETLSYITVYLHTNTRSCEMTLAVELRLTAVLRRLHPHHGLRNTRDTVGVSQPPP